MKRIIFTLFSIAALYSFSAAQQLKHCGTTEAEQEYLKNHPEIAGQLDEFQRQNKEYKRLHPVNSNLRNQSAQSSTAIYTIPVVIHVLHQWGAENISDAQIFDAMNILNEDFQKLNADTTQIIPVFQSIAGNAQVQFRLATLDQFGNCTNGIDRIVTSLTENASDASKLNAWPRNMYLNVWVVKTIGSQGVAGYTYRPANNPNAAIDGIIILHDYIGSIGTGNPGTSRALTHEIGHWLDLPHTWGGTNQPGVACGDDGISDTPITEGSVVGNCNLNLSVCNPPIIENVQNYMDYSYCSVMYTDEQCLVMQQTLNAYPSLGRDNLSTQTNLIATGTTGTAAVCAPVALFKPDKRMICVGNSLTFYDASTNISQGASVTRQWTFNGGTPSTDTSPNPVIQYNTPGVYDVTLSVTTAGGTSTLTEPMQVYVSSIPGANVVPFTEDFETLSLPTSTDWLVDNPSGGSQWDIVNGVGHGGTKSMRLFNYSGNLAGLDVFVTPDYNCSNVVNGQLSFWVAFALRQSTSAGQLKVYSSTNCGITWLPRYTKADAALKTVTNTVFSSFIPTSTQWRQDIVNLTSGAIGGKSNFRLKFEYDYDPGKANNLYIDDINLSVVTGLDQMNLEPSQVTVYPNPSDKFSTVSMNLLKQNDVRISVTDILGKEVFNFVDKDLAPNEYQFDIPCSNWNSGVYMVRIFAGDQLVTKKLTIE